jgi:hypothetical protein
MEQATMTTATEAETMYLLMRVVSWETMGMITNMGDPVLAPECVGFCLVFASLEAATEAASDGEKILPVRKVQG